MLPLAVQNKNIFRLAAAQALAGGVDSPLAVFTILGVLSVVALVDVLPFSKKWDADLRAMRAR